MSNQFVNDICGVVSLSGVDFAPLACARPREHAGEHSWATLPTFGKDDLGSQIVEIDRLIKLHSDKLHYHQGFGSHAERVKGLLRSYEDKAIGAVSSAKQFRDDMLVYFRALIIILDMTGNAATHAEKNARLRGAVELLERMVEELRGKDLEIMFSHFRWRDAFGSDLPTRALLDRVHELEREIADLKQATEEAI